MALFLLVRLQDLKELLVSLLVIVKPVLDLAQVVDRVVELAILWLVSLVRVQVVQEHRVITSARERGRLGVLRASLHFVREMGRRVRVDGYRCNRARTASDANREHRRGSEAKRGLVGRDHPWLDHGLAAESGYTVHCRSLDHLAHRCCYSNRVRVIGVEFYAVTGGQESVEAVDEDGMIVKEHRDAFDDAGGVDPAKQ